MSERVCAHGYPWNGVCVAASDEDHVSAPMTVPDSVTPTPPPEPKFEPEREFGSRTEPFTEYNLAKARKTLEKFQKMHWLADYPCERADGGHKAPCLPVDDVEWLFGYIDALTAQVEQLRTERDEIVRNVREELVDLGYCSYMAHNGDMGEVDPECPGTFCHFTTLIANYEQGSPDE